MNQSKKNVIWRGFFLELKCISVFIIDLTTTQNGQIPHFPKFISKKIVVQLKNNGHKLFYRSEMEISEVHCQNFTSYEQKIYQLVSPNLQVHCQNICATKKYITKGQEDHIHDKKILYYYKPKVALILDHSWIILVFFSSPVPWLVSPCLKRTQHKQILICKSFNYKEMYM